MRERLSENGRFRTEVRITPACAGKTERLMTIKTNDWDHPRVCGKDLDYEAVGREYRGSPPRVRERHLMPIKDKILGRITPACAGKTV